MKVYAAKNPMVPVSSQKVKTIKPVTKIEKSVHGVNMGVTVKYLYIPNNSTLLPKG